MNSVSVMILFTTAILLTGLAAFTLSSNLHDALLSASESVSTISKRVSNSLDVISAYTDGHRTYFVLLGRSGSVPITKATIFIDGSPIEGNVVFFKDEREENILNPGDVAFYIVNAPYAGEYDVSFSSASVLFYAGRVAVEELTFRYRRKITVKENSGNDLTNYQVMVELNASTKGNLASCSDLRFWTEGGERVPYWVEECGDSVIVWIKVPEIPANGEVNVYMYYGRPGLLSESNAEETFVFFDDFDSLDGWTCTGECNYVTTSTVDGRSVLVLTSPSGSGANLNSVRELSSLDQVVLEAEIRNFGGASDLDFIWGIDNDQYGYPDWGASPGDNGAYKPHFLIIDEAGASTGTQYTQSSWLTHAIYRTGTAVSSSYNGEFLSSTGTPLDSGHVHIYVDPDSTLRGVYLDWIRVRYYYYPEPSVTVHEEEEGAFNAP